MSDDFIFKTNLFISALLALSHGPTAILSLVEPTNIDFFDIFILWSVVLIEISIIASSFVGLYKPILKWPMLKYQSMVISLFALYFAYMVAKIALFGVPNQSYSFTTGLTTAFCTYSAYLVSRFYAKNNKQKLKFLPWIVAGIVGINEVGMLWRFNEHFSSVMHG